MRKSLYCLQHSGHFVKVDALSLPSGFLVAPRSAQLTPAYFTDCPVPGGQTGFGFNMLFTIRNSTITSPPSLWTDSTGSEVIFPSSHPPSTSLACLSSASQATGSKIRPWCLLPLSKKAVLSPRSPVLSCPSLNTLSLHSSPPILQVYKTHAPFSWPVPHLYILLLPWGVQAHPPLPEPRADWLTVASAAFATPHPNPLASPARPPSLAVCTFALFPLRNCQTQAVHLPTATWPTFTTHLQASIVPTCSNFPNAL